MIHKLEKKKNNKNEGIRNNLKKKTEINKIKKEIVLIQL